MAYHTSSDARRATQLRSRKRQIALDLFVTTLIMSVASLSSFLLQIWTHSSSNVTAVFTLAVVLVARVTDGYGWGIFASLLGVVSVNLLFTAPFLKINFTAAGYPVIFLSLLLISIITSTAAAGIKKQVRSSQAREERIRNLYDFTNQLVVQQNFQGVLDMTLGYLHEQTGCPVLFVRTPDSLANDEELTCGEIRGFVSNAIEQEAIAECFRLHEPTGAGTSVATYAAFHYMPVVTTGKMLGAFGIFWQTPAIASDQLDMLVLILSQVAIALECHELTEETNRIAMEAEREKMRSNLLRSISHDLRTPLTAIIGASAAILENGSRIDAQNTEKLISDIHEDAEWLLRMVENLLSVTRVSQSIDGLRKTSESAEEIIAEAVTRCKTRFSDAQIRVCIPEEPLFIPMDATLIVQVLINLIENAIRYAGTAIDVTLRVEDHQALFSVRDFGPGVSEEVSAHLFDATSREKPKPDGCRGLGIGLSLCKSIIHAHNGTISESNAPDDGAEFRFTLPLEDTEL